MGSTVTSAGTEMSQYGKIVRKYDYRQHNKKYESVGIKSVR